MNKCIDPYLTVSDNCRISNSSYSMD